MLLYREENKCAYREIPSPRRPRPYSSWGRSAGEREGRWAQRERGREREGGERGERGREGGWRVTERGMRRGAKKGGAGDREGRGAKGMFTIVTKCWKYTLFLTALGDRQAE